MKINLGKTELIHFVGIGGIGMSGLALIMNGLGFKIQGSDISDNKNIERLKNKRIPIFLNHNKKNLNSSSILVISSAIKKNNPEIKQAKKLNLPIYSRGEMLGHIVSLMRNVVVTGSHGKTTTTSLISSIFSKAKLDPTIINGGVLNSFGNSAKLGKSNWCLIESDESDGSFLKIPFTYSIVTNIDSEHLDYYKSINNLKKNFFDFIEKTPSLGKTFVCIDDKHSREVLKKIKKKNYYTYGVNKKANFQIYNIIQNENFSKFDLKIRIPGRKTRIRNIKIPLFGLHNRENFEVFVYSTGMDDGSPMRQRIVSDCDHFVDLRQSSTLVAAQKIFDDEIDILVDFSGHTEGSRMEICALRPAPIQATMLSATGTNGGGFYDYVITDPMVFPESSRMDYSETPARLAGSTGSARPIPTRSTWGR